MSIQYINKIDEVNWLQVSKIINHIGWGERSPRALKSAFTKSSFVRFAYDGDKFIGMGRTVDDGMYYGWIVDLIVLPEYQGKGIGGYILKQLEEDLKPFISTMLTAAPGKSTFYEKRGWIKQTAAYIWPRSKQQKRAFTEGL